MRKKPAIQGCIFDLDGVLTDTAHLHHQSWKKLASEWGFDHTADLNKQLKGISRAASLDLILKWSGKKASDDEKKKMMTLKNQWYRENIKKLSPGDCLPQAVEFLNHLEKHNIPFALASGSKNARLILDQIGLAKKFKWVMDGNDVKRGKPDPELFIKAAEKMGVQRCKTIVFEDAESGITAALKGGFLAVSFGVDEEPKKLSHFHIESWTKVTLSYLENGLEKTLAGLDT